MTHHPIANALYYEEQKDEAKKRASYFTSQRIPKFFGYYEKILQRNGKAAPYFCSAKRFATPICRYFKWSRDCATLFPAPWQKWHRTIPRAIALHDQVAARPRIKKYLASPRRLAFNTNGIFRHYPELDEQ